MIDKKILAILMVQATIMAGTVIYTTAVTSDGEDDDAGSARTVSPIGDDVSDNATYTWTFRSANTSMGTVSKQSAQVSSGVRMGYYDDGGIATVLPQQTYCCATPATGYVFDYWEGGIPKQPEYINPSSNLTLTAHFKQTWTSGDCTCTLTDDGVFTVSGNGAMADYEPSGTPWLSVHASIISVDIEDGVTHIGHHAFYPCRNLASVTIGNSVTSIGISAFLECESLTSVTIPDSVTDIGLQAFSHCTSLTSLTIPDSVTSLGKWVFWGCTSLTSISVNADNTKYSSEDGVLFDKAKTQLIQYPIGNTRTSYVIPETVTSIGDHAFDDCTSLTSVTIGDSVTAFGEYAFSDCTSLTDIFFITTTWNVTSIGPNAFSLGTSEHPVTATIHSPNNVANGKLDAYKGNYTTLNYVASTQHTYTISANPSGYGTVSPASVQIWDGTNVVPDGNRLVFTDGQIVTATPSSATAQYTYKFKDWTFGNLSQTANFVRDLMSYTVTFQSSDASAGSVSPATVTVPYGTTYTVNGNVLTFSDGQKVTATPSPATAQYTYSFRSWSSQSGTITQNTTVAANFTKTINQYTVMIISNNTDYGTVSLGSVTVDYGTPITASDNVLTVGSVTSTATHTPSTAQYTYAFDSWAGIPSGGTITADMTITANFTRDLVYYDITFVANNSDWGSVDPTSARLPYGATILVSLTIYKLTWFFDLESHDLATAIPTPSTEQYSYILESWTGIPESVTGDVTITANFAKQTSYKVTFEVNKADYGSVQYGSLWIQENSTPTVDGNIISFASNAVQNTATPAQATDEYFYAFESWTGVPEKITRDVTITAQFIRADKMTVDVMAKEVMDIDVSQKYSGATEHHQTDYGDWISISNGHLKGTVPQDLAEGHYFVWWEKSSVARADWTAYYVILHLADTKTVQLSPDAEQTIHADGKMLVLGRGIMTNQMAKMLDGFKDITKVMDIRGLTTIQYMPAITAHYILVLGDSVTSFKDESSNHFDAVVIGAGMNAFTVTGFHAYDKDGKDITGSALRGKVLIENRTMQYVEINITEVDNHYHNATCYAVQGSTLDNSENDHIKFSVTSAASSVPQYILDLLRTSGQSWSVEMQSGSGFKNVGIDAEGILQGVQSNSVGTFTGTQSALFTNTDYGAMYSCTMSQAIAFQVFVQYKLVVN